MGRVISIASERPRLAWEPWRVRHGRIYRAEPGFYWVYVMRYPRDARVWRHPCKVGITGKHPLARLQDGYDKFRTYVPEWPEFPLCFIIDGEAFARQIETSVKEALADRACIGPGTEWFETTPREIARLVRMQVRPRLPLWRRITGRVRRDRHAEEQFARLTQSPRGASDR